MQWRSKVLSHPGWNLDLAPLPMSRVGVKSSLLGGRPSWGSRGMEYPSDKQGIQGGPPLGKVCKFRPL